MPLWIRELYIKILKYKCNLLSMIIDKNGTLFINGGLINNGDRSVQEFINDLQKE